MTEKISQGSQRFIRWWEGLSYRQHSVAKRLMKISTSMLSYMRAGSRPISPANAIRIANASRRMAATDARVEVLDCGDLAAACRQCPHYRDHILREQLTDAKG